MPELFVSPFDKTAGSLYLSLCVHLQDVHHIDHDVLVCFLVLSHSKRHSQPAGSTRTHVSLSPFLSPLTHLENEEEIPCQFSF